MFRFLVLLVFLASLVSASVSFAAPAGETDPTPPGSNPSVALGLSIGGTTASAALVVGSLFVASPSQRVALNLAALVLPSAGLAYTRSWQDAAIGIGVRATGAAVLFLSFKGGEFCLERGCNTDVFVEGVWLGSLLIIGGMSYGIIMAPRQARLRRELRTGTGVSWLPGPVVGPSGSLGLGVQLQWRF